MKIPSRQINANYLKAYMHVLCSILNARLVWFGFRPYCGYEATIVVLSRHQQTDLIDSGDWPSPPRPGSGAAGDVLPRSSHTLLPVSSLCQSRLNRERMLSELPQRHLAHVLETRVFNTRDRSLLSGKCMQRHLPRFWPPLAGLQRLQDPQPLGSTQA